MKIIYLFLFAVTLTSATSAYAEFAPTEKIVGVGLMLNKVQETGAVFVEGLVPNAPAEKSGMIEIGMQLISIINAEGELVDATEADFAALIGMIRGEVGTQIMLNFFEEEKGLYTSVSLTREEFEVGE